MQLRINHIINISINSAILLFVLLFVYSCNSKSGSIETDKVTPPVSVQKEITVYGSQNCDHCVEFKKQADSLAIKYTFKDVETNAMYYSELVKKIKDANYQGYISFPVIEIDGKINVNPPFAEFMKMIK